MEKWLGRDGSIEVQNRRHKFSGSSNNSCKRCETYHLRARSWRTSMAGLFSTVDFLAPPCDLDHSRAFKSIQEFHNHLRGGIQFHPKICPEVIELINLHDRAWPPLVFTHGDLSSLNILVREDEVVGIIDWETSGWLPSYWEYTTACQVNPQNYFWRYEIDKFLDPMPAELAMEKIRQRYFGDF